jgi:hypothetical protein
MAVPAGAERGTEVVVLVTMMMLMMEMKLNLGARWRIRKKRP